MEAIVRLFLQAAFDNMSQRERYLGIRRAQFRQGVIQHRVHALDGRVAPERARAAEHFVEHAAECKNVGAMIRRFAAHLLGRHVGRRAQHHSRLGGVDDGVSVDTDGCGFTPHPVPLPSEGRGWPKVG